TPLAAVAKELHTEGERQTRKRQIPRNPAIVPHEEGFYQSHKPCMIFSAKARQARTVMTLATQTSTRTTAIPWLCLLVCPRASLVFRQHGCARSPCSIPDLCTNTWTRGACVLYACTHQAMLPLPLRFPPVLAWLVQGADHAAACSRYYRHDLR